MPGARFEEMIARLTRLERLPRIVVLTGAGISSESGISTFRDCGGLWENHLIEDVATPRGFLRNPTLVYHFYNERRRQALHCSPNRAHFALYALEQRCGDNFHLITQNVDHLHEKAGTRRLWHMHGELLKARCVGCSRVFDWTRELDKSHVCPLCQAAMRPHIVWFEEIPFYLSEIRRVLCECDLFAAIGTSGVVFPAAGFYETAARSGAYTVELNLESTGSEFDCVVEGPATVTVPVLIRIIR